MTMINKLQNASPWGKNSFELARFCGMELSKRDRLISVLMQDRGALRLVSAPHGYGKSLLCYEYARRMLSDGRITWIDGPSPEFYHALDNGELIPPGAAPDEDPNLVVIDDLPWLDESRRAVLIKHVDALLYKGTEVMITTLPSNDFMRSSQPDRILVSAEELMVLERDIRQSPRENTETDLSIVKEHWRAAQGTLFGKAPCAVWPKTGAEQFENLVGFFEEKLPLEFKKAAFAILLMGKGTFNDLERVGAKPRLENNSAFPKDYPFLGLDPMQQEFKVGAVPFDDLKRAVVESGLGNALLKGSMPLCEKCLGVLLNRGETNRAGAIMDVFCSDARCEAWLRDCGWDLLDASEFVLLQTLFDRCREETLANDRALQALRSWVCGMQGNEREASYYAQEVLRSEPAGSGQEDNARFSKLTAYMGVLAFSQGGPSIVSKDSYGPGEIRCAHDFLAAATDLCTEGEIYRALGVLEGKLAPTAIKRSVLPAPDEQREQALEALFTCYAEQFRRTLSYRIALHLVFMVNSEALRTLAKELGCGLLIEMRKTGLSSFSQAAIVADLWRNGFFGLDGRSMDAYDARVLDSAATYLSRLTRLSGKEPAAIPWQNGSKATTKAAARVSNKKHRGRAGGEPPIAHVKLFGGMEVSVGERYIDGSQWNHKSLQLFAMLVMYQGRDVPRQLIFDHIWPDLPRARALDNFYSAWSRAQSLVGEGPYMMRRGDFCSVHSRYVTSDVAEFDQLVRRLLTERDDASTLLDIYARLEVLYSGGLLPSEQGNAFIQAQRARYKATYVDGMVAATMRSLDVHDTRLAMWFARKAMDEDPKREDVYIALIKAQMMSGQRCSAMRTYTQCRAFMRDELGLDPSTEAQDLYTKLLASDPSLIKLDPIYKG